MKTHFNTRPSGRRRAVEILLHNSRNRVWHSVAPLKALAILRGGLCSSEGDLLVVSPPESLTADPVTNDLMIIPHAERRAT